MAEAQAVTEEFLERLRVALGEPEGELTQFLDGVRPQQLVEVWHQLELEQRRRVLGTLSHEKSAELLANLAGEEQAELLETLTPERVRDILRELDPDDLVDTLQAIEAHDAERAHTVKALLDPEVRATAEVLTRYEEDEAGGLMTPEFISLRATMTVDQVLNFLRRTAPDAETVYYLYVVDDRNRLVGVLSMRDLIVAQGATRVQDIMIPDAICVTADTDQEEVARIMADYDFSVLPVVDGEGRLVGIVTVDDVIDVLESEATEDIHRLGAAPVDIEYARAGPWVLFRKRASWLILLVVSATLTINVVSAYEHLIAELVIVASFIPLLIGTGGNVGAQIATLVVRSLATRELEVRDYFRVLLKESVTGLLLGLAFGLFVAAYVIVFRGEIRVAAALGTSMLLIALMANLIGASMPFLFRRLGIDPALTSSPAIITVTDVLGLLIYFRVVIWILGPLLTSQ